MILTIRFPLYICLETTLYHPLMEPHKKRKMSRSTLGSFDDSSNPQKKNVSDEIDEIRASIAEGRLIDAFKKASNLFKGSNQFIQLEAQFNLNEKEYRILNLISYNNYKRQRNRIINGILNLLNDYLSKKEEPSITNNVKPTHSLVENDCDWVLNLDFLDKNIADEFRYLIETVIEATSNEQGVVTKDDTIITHEIAIIIPKKFGDIFRNRRREFFLKIKNCVTEILNTQKTKIKNEETLLFSLNYLVYKISGITESEKSFASMMIIWGCLNNEMKSLGNNMVEKKFKETFNLILGKIFKKIFSQQLTPTLIKKILRCKIDLGNPTSKIISDFNARLGELNKFVVELLKFFLGFVTIDKEKIINFLNIVGANFISLETISRLVLSKGSSAEDQRELIEYCYPNNFNYNLLNIMTCLAQFWLYEVKIKTEEEKLEYYLESWF